ncbi:hypothetical protein TI39_contig838g00001 [Zymoseptoria brevis]|uniref:Potassium channel domain-containing protein n=1 Tax=Zymoseptoria brevis TaxID=1047168 RepID=A0A0F4GFH6_9PEZI|nr:hypothetical protein TI39_contig838g00001 [Zymoseptoria brevis]
MSHIDPGTGDTVEYAANDVEQNSSAEKSSDKTSQTSPSTARTTWWFASTACPLIAATFGPIANGFSICALVYDWRVYLPPGAQETDGIKIRDPRWLIAVNAVSLVMALIGNSALMLNMARRLAFSTAQPITITGFLLAGILLIADMAALTSSPSYYITTPREAIPEGAHALTMAFYFAIFAASIYMCIAFLMCLTVHGARRKHYPKDFNLTSAQRTLMLQTMAFIAYLLLGALVFSTIEGWRYLDGVYWAHTTLLTIGLGDYAPKTSAGRGLIIPFSICGIIMVGLVVGSIRTLVLDRTKEKMAARIVEKRRESAVHNVDGRKQTIKVSWFAQADFSSDPSLTPAQRREEEFRVMRKVQKAAERERRYLALATSLSFALMLWSVGAVIFMLAEREAGWTYFQSLYFTFVVLMTIGYGDFAPASNAGKAFFVMWSMLAIPSLTILISNMADTVVKWVAEITDWVAGFTVLPGPGGARQTGRSYLGQLMNRWSEAVERYTPFGKRERLVDQHGKKHLPRMDPRRHDEQMMIMLSEKLEKHVSREEVRQARDGEESLERDVRFYHYVLARELRKLQKDVLVKPPKEYSWHDWEYYLKLMGEEDGDRNEGEDDRRESDAFIPGALKPADTFREPQPLRHDLDGATYHDYSKQTLPSFAHAYTFPSTPTHIYTNHPDLDLDGVTDRKSELRASHVHPQTPPSRMHRLRRRPTKGSSDGGADPLRHWSWLSDQSPLMSEQSEAEWILERLGKALVRELDGVGSGRRRVPPVGWGSVGRGIKG